MFKDQFTAVEREKLVELSVSTLWEKDGKPGLDYLVEQRKLKESVIKDFKLGYVPSYVEHQLANRIIFPIYDSSDNLIALHTYSISDESKGLPKYWHEKFRKSFYLYGLNSAKHRIRERGFVLVVEGNFDLLQCHNNDLTNSVAMFGKALSLHQIALLIRYTDKIVLGFDGDNAGKSGQEKTSIEMKEFTSVVPPVFSLTGVEWPELKTKTDPDEYIRENGIRSFKILVQKALNKLKPCQN